MMSYQLTLDVLRVDGHRFRAVVHLRGGSLPHVGEGSSIPIAVGRAVREFVIFDLSTRDRENRP